MTHIHHHKKTIATPVKQHTLFDFKRFFSLTTLTLLEIEDSYNVDNWLEKYPEKINRQNIQSFQAAHALIQARYGDRQLKAMMYVETAISKTEPDKIFEITDLLITIVCFDDLEQAFVSYLMAIERASLPDISPVKKMFADALYLSTLSQMEVVFNEIQMALHKGVPDKQSTHARKCTMYTISQRFHPFQTHMPDDFHTEATPLYMEIVAQFGNKHLSAHEMNLAIMATLKSLTAEKDMFTYVLAKKDPAAFRDYEDKTETWSTGDLGAEETAVYTAYVAGLITTHNISGFSINSDLSFSLTEDSIALIGNLLMESDAVSTPIPLQETCEKYSDLLTVLLQDRDVTLEEYTALLPLCFDEKDDEIILGRMHLRVTEVLLAKLSEADIKTVIGDRQKRLTKVEVLHIAYRQSSTRPGYSKIKWLMSADGLPDDIERVLADVVRNFIDNDVEWPDILKVFLQDEGCLTAFGTEVLSKKVFVERYSNRRPLAHYLAEVNGEMLKGLLAGTDGNLTPNGSAILALTIENGVSVSHVLAHANGVVLKDLITATDGTLTTNIRDILALKTDSGLVVIDTLTKYNRAIFKDLLVDTDGNAIPMGIDILAFKFRNDESLAHELARDNTSLFQYLVTDMAGNLTRAGIDVLSLQTLEGNILAHCLAIGDVELLKDLITDTAGNLTNNGLDILKLEDVDGDTLAHCLAQDSVEILKDLLTDTNGNLITNGIDILKLQDLYGATVALLLAKHSVEIFKDLLTDTNGNLITNGIDILKLEDVDGDTLAHCLAQDSVEILKDLLTDTNGNLITNGIDILKLQDLYGATVALLLAKHSGAIFKGLLTDTNGNVTDNGMHILSLNTVYGYTVVQCLDRVLLKDLITDSAGNLTPNGFDILKLAKLDGNTLAHHLAECNEAILKGLLVDSAGNLRPYCLDILKLVDNEGNSVAHYIAKSNGGLLKSLLTDKNGNLTKEGSDILKLVGNECNSVAQWLAQYNGAVLKDLLTDKNGRNLTKNGLDILRFKARGCPLVAHVLADHHPKILKDLLTDSIGNVTTNGMHILSLKLTYNFIVAHYLAENNPGILKDLIIDPDGNLRPNGLDILILHGANKYQTTVSYLMQFKMDLLKALLIDPAGNLTPSCLDILAVKFSPYTRLAHELVGANVALFKKLIADADGNLTPMGLDILKLEDGNDHSLVHRLASQYGGADTLKALVLDDNNNFTNYAKPLLQINTGGIFGHTVANVLKKNNRDDFDELKAIDRRTVATGCTIA